MTPSTKMYVLVRDDIPIGYQLAQSVHAAVEFSLQNPAVARANPTVVVLSVEDEDALLDYADGCHYSGIPYHVFHEPDIEAHTALCTVSDGTEFADLPLAGCVVAC